MRNLPQGDIRRLVSRAQNGEKDAFNELYRATSRAQYFTAITLLKDKILAEDAVQTTYLKVYQNLSTLSDPASFLSWLTSITYNNCMMLLRKRKRTDPELDADISVEIPDPDAEACMLDTVIHQENHQFLLKLLDNLTPTHKTVILLRYYQGLKIKEIAKITDTTDGTVRSRIHYALKKLQKILNEKGFHGTESILGTAALLTSASKQTALPAPLAAVSAKSGDRIKSKVICAGCAVGLILSLGAWSFSAPELKTIQVAEAHTYRKDNTIIQVTVDGTTPEKISAQYKNGETLPVKKESPRHYNIYPSRNGEVEILLYKGSRITSKGTIAVNTIDSEAPELKGYLEKTDSYTLYLSDNQSGINYDHLKAVLSDGTPLDIRPEDSEKARRTSSPVQENKKTGAVTVTLPATSPGQKSDDHITVTAEDNAGNQKTWYIQTSSVQTAPATRQ